MLEKIRRDARGELEAYYQPTLGQGFDRMLAEHLGIPFAAFRGIYSTGRESEAEVEIRLAALLPEKLEVERWNRRLVQRGLQGYGKFRLALRKSRLGLNELDAIQTMADLIDYLEGRIDLPGS